MTYLYFFKVLQYNIYVRKRLHLILISLVGNFLLNQNLLKKKQTLT
jgi:hypothetical protein